MHRYHTLSWVIYKPLSVRGCINTTVWAYHMSETRHVRDTSCACPSTDDEKIIIHDSINTPHDDDPPWWWMWSSSMRGSVDKMMFSGIDRLNAGTARWANQRMEWKVLTMLLGGVVVMVGDDSTYNMYAHIDMSISMNFSSAVAVPTSRFHLIPTKVCTQVQNSNTLIAKSFAQVWTKNSNAFSQLYISVYSVCRRKKTEYEKYDAKK